MNDEILLFQVLLDTVTIENITKTEEKARK